MGDFHQKMRLIHEKLFDRDTDKYTQALIDNRKFDPTRYEGKSEAECYQKFFLNRKTLVSRWLSLESLDRCTPDFKKSFDHYAISTYQLKGRPLFTLEDFCTTGNMEAFEDKIDLFLARRNRAQVRTEYRYLYFFCEAESRILCYAITQWHKGEGGESRLTFEEDTGAHHAGAISFSDEGNIFVWVDLPWSRLYCLFHDTNDRSLPYIIGTGMGYLPHDNKVPRAQKILFAKERLNEEESDLLFILNETEVIAAVENRQNLHASTFTLSHFFKYANRLKQYGVFFQKLLFRYYQDQFYYRLAFREFHAITHLFSHIAKKETYFIYDYNRALLELIETVATIGHTSLYMVMAFNPKSFLVALSQQNLELKSRFLSLYSRAGVEIELVVVHEAGVSLASDLVHELLDHHVRLYEVSREAIVHEVNSVDFIFIDLGDARDFVLADPIRDSKEVYKLFTNEVIMDEYKSDYQKILYQSTPRLAP